MPKPSLVTRPRPDHAASAAPERPFRVGSDGLPLLPCHAAAARVACAQSAAPPAVSQFGLVDSSDDVRAQLVARYTRCPPAQQLSEMTLRIDTELELLRRSCFAQRNAQWGHVTPDQFEFRPVSGDAWTPQPANDKLLLRKMKMDGALDGKEFYPPEKSKNEAETVEFVRDRPWPPQEFALKPVAKPSRGRGGKRKAAPMAGVLDPVPLLAKTCTECRTQSTPLWRTRTRSVKVKKQVAVNAAAAAASLANAFVAQGMAKIQPQATEMMEVEEKVHVDVCLRCYLKLERADLFDKKRLEKKRLGRRKKEQGAAAALLEKKRLKQQIQLLKKQQKEHKILAAQQAATDEQVPGEAMQEDEAAPAAVILKFTREEIEAATGANERKKDRKHSRKDKKKKKKHRRKRELLDDSDSDGPTPIPSPAQMNGYVYADRGPEPYSTPQVSAFRVEEVDASRHVEAMEPEVLDNQTQEEDSVYTPSRSSSRKRKSLQRTEPIVMVESPASASKKHKTFSSRSKRAAAIPAPAPIVVAVPPTPSVRKRSRTKKELARERELRALGQYCPVCNEVYEDDDQNTFVCCDSCELWVHGACDPTLTPALIAAMANTEDKYICPLCAGR